MVGSWEWLGVGHRDVHSAGRDQLQFGLFKDEAALAGNAAAICCHLAIQLGWAISENLATLPNLLGFDVFSK